MGRNTVWSVIMALLKSINDGYGVPVSYWRIDSVVNTRNGSNVNCLIKIQGYYTKQTRENGFPPIMENNVEIIMPIETPIPNINLLSAYYYQIKTQCHEYVNAEDDIEE
jgi:hypothetical protein